MATIVQKGHSAQSDLALKVTLFLLLYYTGVFLCIFGEY